MPLDTEPVLQSENITKDEDLNMHIITRPTDPEKLDSQQALNNKAAQLSVLGFHTSWIYDPGFSSGVKGLVAEKVMGPDLMKRLTFSTENKKG